MRQTVYTCDVCGKAKAEANHWYLVQVYGSGELISAGPDTLPGVLVLPWSDYHANSAGVRHVCGEEHVAMLQSRWFSQLKGQI